jgi:hypothetical protein
MVQEWHNFVSGCFGETDLSFAAHRRDEDRAFDLLKLLRESNVGWRATQTGFRTFLSAKVAAQDHIGRQLKKVEARYKPWLLD